MQLLIGTGLIMLCALGGKALNMVDPKVRVDKELQRRPWTWDEWDKYPITSPTIH